VIHQDEVGLRRRYRAFDLLQLAFADQRGGIRPVTPLQELTSDLCACRESQLAEFGQRLLRVGIKIAGHLAGGFRVAERGRACFRRGGRNVKIAIDASEMTKFDSNQKRPLWLTGAGVEAG
jgi:hypothetical protein